MLTPTLIITSTLCALAVVKASQPTTNNVTIDDQYGDKLTHRVPIFLPPDAWTHNSVAAILNPHRVHNGTWHDATHHPGDSARIVNFGFEGVALYVFCIIANMPPPSGRGFDSFADYQFLLDGDFVGEYKHAVEDTDDYFYNTPVYVNRTIPDAFHNFSIVVNSTEQAVLILFDYAIYTTLSKGEIENSATSPQGLHPSYTSKTSPEVQNGSGRRPNTSVVVAITLAGIATFVSCIGILLAVRARCRPMQRPNRLRLCPNSRDHSAAAAHAPPQAFAANTLGSTHRLSVDEVRDHAGTIRELRQTIQDLRAEKRVMGAAWACSPPYAGP
ncbi:hypothetical protein AB1N83_008557 [Pleurotus pulmonarius]